MKKFFAFLLVIVMAFAAVSFAASSWNSTAQPNVVEKTGSATILTVWIDGVANTAVAGTWRIINTATAGQAFTWADTDAGVLLGGSYTPNATAVTNEPFKPFKVYEAYNTAPWNKTYGLSATAGICVDSKGNTFSFSITYKDGL